MQESLDAIIFDLGGVILNLDYNRTIKAFQLLGEENFDKLYTQSQQDKIFDQFETGQINASEFRDYMRQFVPRPISDEEIDEAWNAMLGDLPAHRIDFLRELKKKKRIFLFSNTNEIHLSAFRGIIARAYGNELLLEDVFHQTYYSHLFRARKPHAEAFQKIVDEQGLIPSKTLFIDDSIQHIEGARIIGLNAFHLVNKDITELTQLYGI